MATNRTLWTWHRWLGLASLLPLLWWVGTGFLFAFWSIERVRGADLASQEEAPPASLPAGSKLPEEALAGASSVQVRAVAGHWVVIRERDQEPPRVFSLDTGEALGTAIPEAWARELAARDFAPEADISAVFLYQRANPNAPQAEPPEEYAGPLPAYAVHFAHDSGMHLYLDGLSGQVRARRTEIWRWYDLAFRLHSLDILPAWEEAGDTPKRVLFWLIAGLWFAVGASGAWMWWRLFGRARAKKTAASSSRET
jgi:uncharacterized iron-regulated membrane protein